MGSRGIFSKLLAILIVSGIGLVLVAILSLGVLRAQMIDDATVEMRHMAESGQSIIQKYYDLSKKGELDELTAKAMAAKTIDSIRFSNKNYIFIYDYQGIAVVTPGHPERIGKSFLNDKDPDGVAYIARLVDAARQGGGQVFYRFFQSNDSVLHPKVSFAVDFAPWQWMIGSGAYLDSINDIFWTQAFKSGLAVLIILLIGMGITIAIARNISVPLALLSHTTEKLIQGEYSIEVPGMARNDEIGILGRVINALREEAIEAEDLRVRQKLSEQAALADQHKQMLAIADRLDDKVKGMVDTMVQATANMQRVASSMNNAALGASNSSSSVAAAAAEVSSNVTTVATATGQLTSSISEIARQVGESNSIATKAVADAERTTKLVNSLSETVGRIGDVVNLITDIASQTNLLALNATIEAARAGEAGKGFAVVANEVKVLANQTAKATDEISGQIIAVQSATAEAVTAISGIASVISTINHITTVMTAAITEQQTTTSEIASNCQQAAHGAQEVSSNIRQIVTLTSNVGGAARDVSSSSEKLEDEAHHLQDEVAQFLESIRK